MIDFGYYNSDCVQGMKQFPDKYFDLAIVDPPYGDAGGGGAIKRDSAKDLTDTEQRDRMKASPPTKSGGVPEEQTHHKRTQERTASAALVGPGRRSSEKKLLRGMSRRGKNISRSFSASHVIRLYGGEITLNYLRQDAS